MRAVRVREAGGAVTERAVVVVFHARGQRHSLRRPRIQGVTRSGNRKCGAYGREISVDMASRMSTLNSSAPAAGMQRLRHACTGPDSGAAGRAQDGCRLAGKLAERPRAEACKNTNFNRQ